MSTINFEIINVKNVRGYLDECGIVYVNLEDICKGLGFTRKANSGNTVVRWSRVKDYLNSMSVPTGGHDELPEYIPENIFYNATDFITDLISKHYKVIRFPISGYWIDIGKPADFQKVQELAEHLKK